MMTRDENSKLMVLFVGGLFVVVIAMIVVIFVATRRPVVMVLPEAGTGSQQPAGATSGGSDSGAASSSETAAASEAPPQVPVISVDKAPSTADPTDPAWNQIGTVEIPLERQQSATPMLDDQTVPTINVQAAHDDQRYVWRISWEQAEPCYQSDVSEFSDAVALQFPLKDGAPYTMGGPDMPVTMLYWKALWQKDVDEGFQGYTSIYPNAWYDFYWFVQSKGPQPVTEGFDSETARQYTTGRAVGNPMSVVGRTKPFEELTAHGFGSSTHVADTPSNAQGVWKDGFWYVVFDRPVDSQDPLIARFNENPEQQLIAFAVWDGNNENRGGRKHITQWIPMRIEQ